MVWRIVVFTWRKGIKCWKKQIQSSEPGRSSSKAQVLRYHMRQRLVWGNKSPDGCTPGTCLQTCDKSACGYDTDGCVMRWAALQQHILARLLPAQASIAWRCACYVTLLDGLSTQVSAEAGLRAAYWGQCGWTTSGSHNSYAGTGSAQAWQDHVLSAGSTCQQRSLTTSTESHYADNLQS